MRSVFYDGQLLSNSVIEISKDQSHHLKNVLRVNLESEVQVLDGQGSGVIGIIKSLNKNEAYIKIGEVKKYKKISNIDLFLGCPKKDFFEEVCRSSVELGIRRIFVFQGEYSPWVFKPYPRLKKILINSLLQSNNPYFPEIIIVKNIKEELASYENPIFLFSLKENSSLESALSLGKDYSCLIGPEAGFSEEEEKIFLGLNNCCALRLNSAILRTVTALPAAFGYLQGLKDKA